MCGMHMACRGSSLLLQFDKSRIDVLAAGRLVAVNGDQVLAGTKCRSRGRCDGERHILRGKPARLGGEHAVDVNLRAFVVMHEQADVVVDTSVRQRYLAAEIDV